MTFKWITVTRHTPNGAARIADALARGLRVLAIARSSNWFEVVTFREETTAEGYKFWYATGRPSYLDDRGGRSVELLVTSVAWQEPVDQEK
jgi:hypothetical protein